MGDLDDDIEEGGVAVYVLDPPLGVDDLVGVDLVGLQPMRLRCHKKKKEKKRKRKPPPPQPQRRLLNLWDLLGGDDDDGDE